MELELMAVEMLPIRLELRELPTQVGVVERGALLEATAVQASLLSKSPTRLLRHSLVV
jgi:hypothetical protein